MAEKDKFNKNPSKRRKAARAGRALKLLESYDKLLSSVLIGNTIVGVVISSLATMLCIDLFGIKGVAIASVTVTLIVLVFCEISPKTLAKEAPESTAMNTTPLLHFLMILFMPINFLTSVWKKFIVKLFPAKADTAVTEEEFFTFVEEMRQEGSINRSEEKMIRQVIGFDDLTAAEICTPRMDIAAIDENASADLINSKFEETGFSRLPVYKDSIDKISGLLLLKDFHHLVIGKGQPAVSVFKPAVFVTKTIKIPRLLQTMKKKRAHLAVVVDEFGGTFGIVTIEDIVEELVGEIWDEHDKIEEPIEKAGEDCYKVRGNLNLPAMFDYIYSTENIENQESEIPNISVASWALEILGSLPKIGDQFNSLGVELTVSKISRNRVLEAIVKIRK